MVQAWIRRASQPTSGQDDAASAALEQTKHVRTILRATLSEQVENLQFGWQIASTGHLAWRGRSTCMVVPRPALDGDGSVCRLVGPRKY